MGAFHGIPSELDGVALLAMGERTKEKLMTPRPLYRWKSFWFGILVLGFLLWVERRWESQDLGMSYFNGTDALILDQSHGSIEFHVGALDAEFPLGWDFYHMRFPDAQFVWPSAAEFYWNDAGWGFSGHFSNWFIVLLFLISWCAWLFFHWRREQKKLTA
ncbi:hypothetical protein OKA04_02950 [Luteolibacter flavescens]|uniref:Uncharacterized protein n=1 Tax=Luteolibacter flavescens TaxID=1859460 RepID=A0ABT3FKD2_9BACT|nr:hypothetical protein [Luteolibacter flavescens]MCW1883669.1 hypothetical protein [Luteolibacter flavescens]